MKKTTIHLALVSFLAFAGPALAELDTIEPRPAATLLLPYFEVDLNSLDGINTLFEINNADELDYLAHLTVWSDLSVPVLDFNVYLTGYDVVAISVRDILNLTLPDTAPVSFSGSPSNQGAFSLTNPILDPESCENQLPPPTLPASVASDIRRALTGQSSGLFGGQCGGRNFNDNVARGYITVDVVRECTLKFPGDAGYFEDGGTGEALNDNVLWGNYYFVSSTFATAQAEPLVHVEAEITGDRYTLGDYTFYGRYVDWAATDDREPLPTKFAARYLTNALDTETDLIVWRDSKIPHSFFPCGTLPSWYPLANNSVVVFDEEENPDVLENSLFSPASSPSVPFPAEAQRVAVNSAVLPAFDFGWMHLNLSTIVNGQSPNAPFNVAQAWVVVVQRLEERFSVGYQAIQLDSASNADPFVRPGVQPFLRFQF